MRIAIVGWGVDGKSAYNFFGPEHEYLIASEEPRDDFPPESDKVKIQFLKPPRTPGTTGSTQDLSYLKGVENCDKILYTVTAARNLERLFGDDEDFWSKATTAVELFFEEVRSRNIIGVTGTKGKGTTSTLIAKMLEADGKKVWLGGNIGRGFLEYISDIQPSDWVVLELSSFQLYRLKHSPRLGICLMISEEHMDWHNDMSDYIQAKSNMFRHQSESDIAIYMAGNIYSEQAAGLSKGTKIPYFANPGAYVRDEGVIVVGEDETEVVKTGQLKLLGRHNWQNVCAAVTAVWQVTKNIDAIRQVLTTFSGLEHRLEFVRELNGVKYYDDSFGTNPQTAIVAMEAIVQPVILIAGGYDRGISMDPLIKEILKDRVKHVITIGQTGTKIANLLKEKGFDKVTEGLKTMPDTVRAAASVAEPGDAVLLSAAAASFDMFKNFEERGSQFKEAVNAL